MLPPSAARSRSADPAAEPELVGPPASDLVDVECANRNCALLVTLCSVQLHRKKARRKKLEATEKATEKHSTYCVPSGICTVSRSFEWLAL